MSHRFNNLRDHTDILFERTVYKSAEKHLPVFFRVTLGRVYCKAYDEWVALLKYPLTSLQAPRGHGKSSLVTEAHGLLRAIKTKRDVWIFSINESLASMLLERIKELIEDVPELRYLKPSNPEFWSRTVIKLTNGVKIVASGVVSAKVGPHVGTIICDDLQTRDNSQTVAAREEVHKIFWQEIFNMLDFTEPDSQLIVVGTVQHYKDLYAELAKNEEFICRKDRAILDMETGQVLCPELITFETLLRIKHAIGEDNFLKEYQNIYSDSKSQLFTKQMIDYNKNPDEICGVSRKPMTICMGFDPADSISPIDVGKDLGDHSRNAITILGRDLAGKTILLWQEAIMHLTEEQQLGLLEYYWELYHPQIVIIESNRGQTKFNIKMKEKIPHWPGQDLVTSKNSKDEGIRRILNLLKNGQLILPVGDRNSQEMVLALESELLAMRFNNGRWAGEEHDDRVLSLSLAYEGLITESMQKKGAYSINVNPWSRTHNVRPMRNNNTEGNRGYDS